MKDNQAFLRAIWNIPLRELGVYCVVTEEMIGYIIMETICKDSTSMKEVVQIQN